MGNPGEAMGDLEGSGRADELVVEAYSATAEESPSRQIALQLHEGRTSSCLDHDSSAPQPLFQLREAWPQSVLSDGLERGRGLVVCTIDVQFLTGGSRCRIDYHSLTHRAPCVADANLLP